MGRVWESGTKYLWGWPVNQIFIIRHPKMDHMMFSQVETQTLDCVVQMPESQEKEMVTDLRVDKTPNGDFVLQSVLQRLAECGYQVASTNVSYFSAKDQMYVLANRGPVKPTDCIPASALADNRIQLRFRAAPKPQFPEPQS